MPSKTIAFLGATGGCGLGALKRSVEAGYTCIALCRTPTKLEAQFPHKPANLILKQGNAHDISSVASILVNPSEPTHLVDTVNFSIGGAVNAKFQLDDKDVCKNSISALLKALDGLRAEGLTGKPLLAIVSTTGISKHGRDIPLLMIPLYHYGLKEPHEDKRVAEQSLFDSQERFILVRPSLLQDGVHPEKKIRVHVESEKGIEKKEIGYFIGRDDVGRWMFENLLSKDDVGKYERKAVGLTW